MPRSSSSCGGSPRFVVGGLLAGRFVIRNVLKEGSRRQLLDVTDRSDGDAKIVQAVDRYLVPEKMIMDEIKWLKSPRTLDGRHSEFLEDTQDLLYVYMTFKKFQRNLRDVLDDESVYITRRHIREISQQLLRLVGSLHRDTVRIGDICPENIEFVNGDIIPETIYRDGVFTHRNVLASAQIRLAYYGRFTLGQPSTKYTGVDQYRSPEDVYGIDLTYGDESDAFSVGCVIAELVNGFPLFPKISEGPMYRREKTVLFDAVLGPFPDHLVRDIRRVHKGIFMRAGSDFPEIDSSISPAVRKFAGDETELSWFFEDPEALDLVEPLLSLDYRTRASPVDLECHEFFSTHD